MNEQTLLVSKTLAAFRHSHSVRCASDKTGVPSMSEGGGKPTMNKWGPLC